mmetsp:Transcript_32788/g.44955  ORF Transcript_32788/g.44955 Transcript_32788/m.44955 type:complete len:87 (-) Transcript_32788:55-315(-)
MVIGFNQLGSKLDEVKHSIEAINNTLTALLPHVYDPPNRARNVDDEIQNEMQRIAEEVEVDTFAIVFNETASVVPQTISSLTDNNT